MEVFFYTQIIQNVNTNSIRRDKTYSYTVNYRKIVQTFNNAQSNSLISTIINSPIFLH